METINITLRLLTISQILLFVIMLSGSNNSWKIRCVGSILMLGVISYLSMPLVESFTTYGNALGLLWFPASITPSMLLLFVWWTFEEDKPLPWPMLAAIIASVGSSTWFRFFDLGLPDTPLWSQLLKIVLVVIAIVVVWVGRQNDLVERRYKIRNLFILSLASLMLVITAAEMITDFNMPVRLSSLSIFVIFVYALALNCYFIRENPKIELDTHQHKPVQSDSEDPLIKSLLHRMQDERLYADHDLRVGSLAQIMNVPEYQLRKKINQQLGYRNFNQFVNRYRIEEAGQRLLDNTRTPVLTIALDVGFRSISSFNTAFQTQFGVSPTQYRAEALSGN